MMKIRHCKTMRNINIILAISLLLPIFNSCKKDAYHTIVEGKVVNWGSKQPIDSVLVTLKDGVASGGGWVDLGNGGGTSSTKKSTVYTNEKGEFKVELSGENQAVLYLSKKGYTFHTQEGGIKGYSDGSFKNEVLEMEANAFFDPIFTSKNKTYDSDTLIIKMLSQSRRENGVIFGDRYGITGFGATFKGIGPFRYSDRYPYLSVGDSYQPFSVTLKQQGVTKTGIDSVFIKSLETYKDTVYY